jgi:hypothetical protein
MTDYDPRDEETPVISGPAPTPEPDNPLVPVSLVATLTKAEIDQQIAAAHQHKRSLGWASDQMITMATMDPQMAVECIYSVPRGGKQIRGPSIRFAEIVMNCWGNIRCAARVTHEDVIEQYVEAEAVVHDLENNVGYVARARRRIQLKKGRKSVDPDMTQLAGAAAISVARRNAILASVPKPVWRKALEAVEGVIRGEQKTLIERRDAAVQYFNKAGVSTERILRSLELQHLDDITLDHLIDLNGMRSALKTGESTLDQLFPEERAPGPKPETLADKLQALSTVDPETGEIKPPEATPAQLAELMKSGVPPEVALPGGAGAAVEAPQPGGSRFPNQALPLDTPAETVNVPQRAKRTPRTPTPTLRERLQTEGDACAAKGRRALDEWWDSLTSDEVAILSPAMYNAWRVTADKVQS